MQETSDQKQTLKLFLKAFIGTTLVICGGGIGLLYYLGNPYYWAPVLILIPCAGVTCFLILKK